MKTLLALLFALAILPASAGDYIGLSVGRTQTHSVFKNARFAFPDMAQSGNGLLNETSHEDDVYPSFRIVAGREWDSGLGAEISAAWLGTAKTAFDVSGPFGGGLGRTDITYGRCVESGKFSLAEATVAIDYNFHVPAGITITPKLGLSAMLAGRDTHSRCDFNYTDGTSDSATRVFDDSRFSWSPMVGLGLRMNVTPKWDVTLDAEVRQATLSNNEESQSYGQGWLTLSSVWLGVERRF